MKTLLAAATAFVLLTGGAMAADPVSNCANTNNKGVQTNGSGAKAGEAPGGTTCEVLVQPDGKETVQNGPAVNATGSDTAPHESGSGGNGAAQ